jgi:hypothetical protein
MQAKCDASELQPLIRWRSHLRNDIDDLRMEAMPYNPRLESVSRLYFKKQIDFRCMYALPQADKATQQLHRLHSRAKQDAEVIRNFMNSIRRMTAQVAETQARSHFPSSIRRWGLSRSIIPSFTQEQLKHLEERRAQQLKQQEEDSMELPYDSFASQARTVSGPLL